MLLFFTVLVVFILSLALFDFIFSLTKLFILYVKTASLLALANILFRYNTIHRLEYYSIFLPQQFLKRSFSYGPFSSA